MKLKKQQIMILAIVLILVISVSSIVLVLIGGNGDSPSGNGDMVEAGNWLDISSNIQAVTAKSEYGIHSYGDVFFVDENEGWVVSNSIGEIYHTTDGGETWEVQTTEYDTSAIWMLDKNEGYAGGAQGRVYRTTDGGKNWNAIGSIGNTLADISFAPAGGTGYCCGHDGNIWSVDSTGVHRMTSGINGDLYSLSFPVISEEGWVCGGGILCHYTGGSWTLDQTNPSGNYNGICFVESNKGWAVGSKIIQTVDGQNWALQTNPDHANDRGMNDVFFSNSNEGWIIGERGLIMHTTNGGATWTVEAEGVTNNYLCAVHFPSSNVGYVCGNDGTLLKYIADN
jgi:photosystem II stability/assembly factor-like uncharacterized protein